MSVTGVSVRIYDEGKCIHETVRPDGNDLRTLMRNLRDTQSEVNDFLTALIQRQDAAFGGPREMANRSDSEVTESDSEEEEEEDEGETRANPQKCKLST